MNCYCCNHKPDERALKRLEARKILFEAAAESTGTMKETFDATLGHLNLGDSIGYETVSRTMKRRNDENHQRFKDKVSL